jgi:hypothetical protein
MVDGGWAGSQEVHTRMPAGRMPLRPLEGLKHTLHGLGNTSRTAAETKVGGVVDYIMVNEMR